MTDAPALTMLPSLPLDERRDLPDTPAIYVVMAGDTVLYVGQSVNLRQRWLAHHRFAQLNERGGCRIAWMQVEDASLLDELERACIAHFHPVLNDSPILGGRGPQISVGFRQDDLDDLRDVAEETDTPVATLIRQWTLERLRQAKPRRRGQGEEG
jgi:hypothetical protein